MSARHLELLVEEPSAEAFLRGLLPRMLPESVSFQVYVHQGKMDLMTRLPERLRGYANWLPLDWRIIILLDRDDDDCVELKATLETIAADAGMTTRARGAEHWRVATRIAVEELEAWYFGEWGSVRACFPRVGETLAAKAPYRASDAIQGGTWEAFERELQKVGYFRSGLRKIEAARTIAAAFDPARCSSPSFRSFAEVLLDAVAEF